MVKIILLGDKSETAFGDFLLHKLCKNFHVIFVTEKQVCDFGCGEDLLLTEVESGGKVRTNGGILVLKDCSDGNILDGMASIDVAILNSENKMQLKELAKKNSAAITCGASSKDTVTFSSKDEENLVVAVQRPIKTVGGEICEPLEVSIETKDCPNDYSALAYVAIATKIGIFNKNYH